MAGNKITFCATCGISFRHYKPDRRFCSNSCWAKTRRNNSDNFWENADKKADGCWLWKGATSDGYGQIRFSGRSQRAHRVAWLLAHGDIPSGLYVCHHCDVRMCVNPSHLFLGTHADNIADMWNKDRGPIGNRSARRRHPESYSQSVLNMRGEGAPLAKLRDEDILDIRSRRANGETLKSIAQRYGVDSTNVGCIVRRKTWKHI